MNHFPGVAEVIVVAARRDVRFYHVGAPQLKKSLFLLLLVLFFKKILSLK